MTSIFQMIEHVLWAKNWEWLLSNYIYIYIYINIDIYIQYTYVYVYIYIDINLPKATHVVLLRRVPYESKV